MSGGAGAGAGAGAASACCAGGGTCGGGDNSVLRGGGGAAAPVAWPSDVGLFLGTCVGAWGPACMVRGGVAAACGGRVSGVEPLGPLGETSCLGVPANSISEGGGGGGAAVGDGAGPGVAALAAS